MTEPDVKVQVEVDDDSLAAIARHIAECPFCRAQCDTCRKHMRCPGAQFETEVAVESYTRLRAQGL